MIVSCANRPDSLDADVAGVPWRANDATRRAAREGLVADLGIPEWHSWPKIVAGVDRLLDDVGEKVVARWRVEVLYRRLLDEGRIEDALVVKEILDA